MISCKPIPDVFGQLSEQEYEWYWIDVVRRYDADGMYIEVLYHKPDSSFIFPTDSRRIYPDVGQTYPLYSHTDHLLSVVRALGSTGLRSVCIKKR